MKNITIELTPDEFSRIHSALLALPMSRVEQLVARLRKAAVEASKPVRSAESKEADHANPA
jgi:hypothetical protein